MMTLYSDLGSTMLEVLGRYQDSLTERNSKLMLAGVNEDVMSQLRETGMLSTLGRDNIFEKTELVGEPGHAAYEAAEQWIAQRLEKDAG